MAIDTKQAILGAYDIDEDYHYWRREKLEEWVEQFIGEGIDPNEPTTFDPEHVNAIKAVLEELGGSSTNVLRDSIENILDEMKLNMEELEGGEGDDEKDQEEHAATQNFFDPNKLISQLASEGWMTDNDWKEFGIQQGGVCVDEKVMRDIASRWDKERLALFPDHSKFEYKSEGLPPGQEHYILTTSEWKLMMGSFSSVPSMPVSTGDLQSFCMWKLENGKSYVDWCKGSDLRQSDR